MKHYYNTYQTDFTWESKPTIMEFKIYVPVEIIANAYDAQSKVSPNYEVGFYLKGAKQADSITVTDIYLPEQVVTSSTIEFKEPPPEGFTGVMHIHPMGLRTFSSTDWEYINKNFDFSVLLCDHEPTDACVRINTDEAFILIRSKPFILYSCTDPKWGAEEIKRKVSKVTYTSKYHKSYYPDFKHNDLITDEDDYLGLDQDSKNLFDPWRDL